MEFMIATKGKGESGDVLFFASIDDRDRHQTIPYRMRMTVIPVEKKIKILFGVRYREQDPSFSFHFDMCSQKFQE